LLGWNDVQSTLLTVRGALSIVLLSVLITCILLAILIPRERAARAQMRIAQEEARVAAAEKETAIARMQLLSAQVEPHFLYNTLAHVVSLVDAEPATAKRMLDRLIALLRSTAAAMNGGGTLGSQVDHLRAYLDILAMRMGSRLTWKIDVPPELAALAVPPMLLQPVVENAIKHGLEPKVDGGDVTVTARRDRDRLVLTVADTGLGFRALRHADSTGLGLANLRARLAALYGTAAALTIVDNAPSGARVTLALPFPETPVQ
jgi:LytS/YehU family sensor histidine kinase